MTDFSDFSEAHAGHDAHDAHDAHASELENALRRELLAASVPFDAARADQMIATATAGGLRTSRSWAAPVAAAAAVVLVGGGTAWIAAGSGGGSGTPAAGGEGCPTASSSAPSGDVSSSDQVDYHGIYVPIDAANAGHSAYHSRLTITLQRVGSASESASAGDPCASDLSAPPASTCDKVLPAASIATGSGEPPSRGPSDSASGGPALSVVCYDAGTGKVTYECTVPPRPGGATHTTPTTGACVATSGSPDGSACTVYVVNRNSGDTATVHKLLSQCSTVTWIYRTDAPPDPAPSTTPAAGTASTPSGTPTR